MLPSERFSSRAADYARYRPGYPPAALALLRARCGLAPQAQVADIGSGTGLLTQSLLASGAQVFAVEPNDSMRAAAEKQLKGEAGFHSVKGSAESTTLPSLSIDLWVAGQAFHWFDVAASRCEALRIARPGACAALLWNERPADAGPFSLEYEALLRRYAPEYERIAATRANEASMREFFGGTLELASFPNQQRFDLEGLRGRLMSSSYAPQAGQPGHEPLLRELRLLFERYQRGGRITFPYQTLLYFAPLKPLR